MRIYIKKVGKSNYNPKAHTVSSYWILAYLRNGREILINDLLPYDLRKFEGKEIDCLMHIMLGSVPKNVSPEDDPDSIYFTGKYLGKQYIPKKWELSKEFDSIYDFFPEYHVILIEDDFAIIEPYRISWFSIKEGDSFTFRSLRFDLLAWEPCEHNIINPQVSENKFKPQDFINKFWGSLEKVLENNNNYSEDWYDLHYDILYKELNDWSSDDLYLFDEIYGFLTEKLRFNDDFMEKISSSSYWVHLTDDGWYYFCLGLVALGKKVYYLALRNTTKFIEKLCEGKYGNYDDITRESFAFLGARIKEDRNQDFKRSHSKRRKEVMQIRDLIIENILSKK